MSDFQRVPLGEVARVKSGFAFKSRDWSESGIPVVKIANLKDGQLMMEGCSHVPPAVAMAAKDSMLAVGDVLISMTGYIGEVAQVREDIPLALNQRVGRFAVIAPDRLDSEYLYYVLQLPTIRAELELRAYGAAQPNISPTLIHAVEIPLPSLDVQRQIADTLSAYDDLIENNTRRIAILEEMAQRLYREWFVHFRYPGHESVPLVESELGLIPEGWEVRELGSIASIGRGLSYSGKGLTEDGHPMINLKNLRPEGGFRKEGTKPYSGSFKSRHEVSFGDVLVANTDLTQAGNVVGAPMRVPRSVGEGTVLFTHHLYSVRPKDQNSDLNTFLYYLLLDSKFRSHARAHALGTTVLGLSASSVEGYSFVMPKPLLIESFARIAPGFIRLAEALEETNVILQNTRDLVISHILG